MGKVNLRPIQGEFVGDPRIIKYHFVKLDFKQLFDEDFFEDRNSLGVAFSPFSDDDEGGKINIRAIKFEVNSTRNGIVAGIGGFASGKSHNQHFRPGEVIGFDFAFLDKVQLEWLLGIMGPFESPTHRLCLSNCYINLADTPPHTNAQNNNTPYLTFKLWLEKILVFQDPHSPAPNKKTLSFPQFTIIPPCPPVWPPISKFENSYFFTS